MPRQIASSGRLGGRSPPHERHLERIAAWLGRGERRVRGLAVQLRVDVAAAGQDQRVEAVECRVGAPVHRIERTHLGAGACQRLLVVA